MVYVYPKKITVRPEAAPSFQGPSRRPGWLFHQAVRGSGRPTGFTLMEIMVVVFIISLLVTLVGVKLFDSMEKAKRATAAANIASMKAALRLYKLDHGRYPSTSEGLQKLAEVPEGGEESYLEGVQNDPWGNAYVYSSDGRQFLLRSLARDGQDGGGGFDADISSEAA